MAKFLFFIVMGLFLFILVSSILVWYGMEQIATSQHKEPSSPSSSEEYNTSSPCIHPLTPVAGTVDNMVASLGNRSDNYVSLVRFIINFTTVDEVQHNQTLWHWGLGGRGRFMLALPYDNYSLSFGTLKFGIHPISITLNSSIVDNGSFSDICMVHTLFNISRDIRSRVQTPYTNDTENDVICREIDESHPFNIKLIPGYSLFGLQASTYYKCWSITEINNNRVVPETEIHGFIVKLAFMVTYSIIFLAVAFELCGIYARVFNYKKGDKEKVNILQIQLIPSYFAPYLLLFYRILFFLSYFGIFIWHVLINDEYENLSLQRGDEFKMYTWGLDFILANILYLLGLLVLFIYISWYNDDGHVLEEPYNLTKLVCNAVVFILCFFRFSATISLFVEIFFLTGIGIVINISYVSPIWIIGIIAVLWLRLIFTQFYDKYQTLYNNIYSVGRKVDEENTFPNKIFEQSQNHENGASQRQFKIKSSLLEYIKIRRLPLRSQIFNSITHFMFGLAFIFYAVVIVYAIAGHVEYAITIVSLVLGAASMVTGNSMVASGKEKNRAQDELIQLEADLEQYAKTGEIPPPEASHWRSFFRRVSSHFSNAPERYQNGEYQRLEGSTDYHSEHSVLYNDLLQRVLGCNI